MAHTFSITPVISIRISRHKKTPAVELTTGVWIKSLAVLAMDGLMSRRPGMAGSDDLPLELEGAAGAHARDR